jgi:hypothetical protein
MSLVISVHTRLCGAQCLPAPAVPPPLSGSFMLEAACERQRVRAVERRVDTFGGWAVIRVWTPTARVMNVQEDVRVHYSLV